LGKKKNQKKKEYSGKGYFIPKRNFNPFWSLKKRKFIHHLSGFIFPLNFFVKLRNATNK